MRYITFALAKGRLAHKAMCMLCEIGAANSEMREEMKESRKLVFVDEQRKFKFFLAKASDVPTYVEYGAADIGIAGADTLLEEKRDLYEVADLGFGSCRIVVAGTPAMKSMFGRDNNIRVSTKYPRIASEYFHGTRRQTIEIIKLNGSVELGPIVGLSDVIVDIVETGSTIKENGLEIIDEICEVSARMVVNRVSMKMERTRISELIEKVKECASSKAQAQW
ncbi:MAG: ATP phosphoribosyltransferase [Clostridiales bacterium]|nr:ATP phosphoribosyltransferase [Clostridiales bacterium]